MPGGFFDWSKCFLGFARFTLSLQYIYTRWSLSTFSCSLHTLSPSPAGRWSLSACSCSLHTLSPSPDLNKTSLASLSPLTAAQRAGRIRPPGREGGLTLSPSARDYRRSCSLSTQRRRGRASEPFFFIAVPSPTKPRPKNLKV